MIGENMTYIWELIELLNKLEKHRIYYKLNKIRFDAIMIEIAVPGERWEVEFVTERNNKCSVEIERFKSNGNICDEKELKKLFDIFSDEYLITTQKR